MLPAPAVQAYWYIPRLARGEWVHFLIDTGASGTCLNGIYALDLQDHMRRNTLDDSYGIGGGSKYYYERAIVVFLDDNNEPLAQNIQLGIQCIQKQDLSDPPDLDLLYCLYCPCLLGRDILNDCIFSYNTKHNEVTLTFP